MTPHYADDDVTLYAGDCLDVLREMPDASVDAVVTDPPYGLEFMGNDWDRPWAVGMSAPGYTDAERLPRPSFNDSRNANCRRCGGRQRGAKRCTCPAPDWDRHPREDMLAYQQWCELWAAECLRVLKPGGHFLAFGGTRTYHRLACAVEDAGFEVRDSIDWIFGSGFPKSLDIGKRTGPEWAGWGSALKPAHEPIVVGRKPFRGTLVGNVLEHGNGALNIDATRVAWGDSGDASAARKAAGYTDAAKRALGTAVAAESPTGFSGEVIGTDSSAGRWPSNVVFTHSPACELVGQRQVASDMHYPADRGRGGISVPGHAGQAGLEERAPGREVIDAYDCAPDCPVAELDRQSGAVGAFAPVRGTEPSSPTAGVYGDRVRVQGAFHGDTGGASRFFPTFRYEPKAGTAERPTADGVVHPTVKPLDLMRWLIRLVVPRGATVLDLFAGSGTTGEACIVEGMKAILIEREKVYLPLIVTRVSKPIEATLALDIG